VNGNVPVAEATLQEGVLPERVQEALGELVGAAKEGLLALSVGVGLGVLTELMEEEVDDVVRRASGTLSGPRSGMATRTVRSRSVAVASRSSDLGRGPRTASQSCRS